MKYCRTCLQPDTRPGDPFVDGNCSACTRQREGRVIDWDERFGILEDILLRFPRKPGQTHDCIIGVSGGKDSLRQALWVRDRLGLDPLLACLVYPPEQISLAGVANLTNLIEAGFDVMVSAPAPGTWRKLVREAFLRFRNWCRATELALYASVPQLAIRHDIPLIFTGENQALRDPRTLRDAPWDYNGARHQNTLQGGALEWILEAGVDPGSVLPYLYPDEEAFARHQLQIVDLGWFIRDWSNLDNGLFAATHGLTLRTEPVSETGDPMSVSALDEDWVALNQMIKYYKFGFGKATDYANEHIRNGRMSRDAAAEFVTRYDGVCADRYIEEFCAYVDLPVPAFWDHVRSSVNRALFDVDTNGHITPKFTVGIDS